MAPEKDSPKINSAEDSSFTGKLSPFFGAASDAASSAASSFVDAVGKTVKKIRVVSFNMSWAGDAGLGVGSEGQHIQHMSKLIADDNPHYLACKELLFVHVFLATSIRETTRCFRSSREEKHSSRHLVDHNDLEYGLR